MPTLKLQVGQKVFHNFLYPPSGKARVIVESDQPVDVIISSTALAPQVVSIQAAASYSANVIIYSRQLRVDQVVILPEDWRQVGWTLTMGHTATMQEPAALHYEVYPA